MYYFWVLLFFLILLLGWGTNLFGLPGNWFIFLAASLFSFLFRNDLTFGLSWWVLLVLGGLAVLGEILEFGASAMGISRGGSRRGAVLSIIGSTFGGLFGAIMGVPLPGIGSLIGGLFFASLGAMLGTLIGEISLGNIAPKTLEIGIFAFVGRLLGSVAKMLVGTVMVGLATGAALLH